MTFVTGPWWSSGRPGRGLQMHASQLPADMDDVELVPMSEDTLDFETYIPPPLPEPKSGIMGSIRQQVLQDKASAGAIGRTSTPSNLQQEAKPKIDGSKLTESLDNDIAELMGTPSSALKKNKKWLRGRGDAKRKKLEENTRLERWLISNGVWLSEKADWGISAHPCSIAIETRETIENEVSGRGLVARRDISKYEEIARIPYNVTINKGLAVDLWGKEIASQMDVLDTLALLLIHEKIVKGEDSFYEPYMSILPSIEEIGCAWTWSEEELDRLLVGSPTAAAARLIKNTTITSFRALQEKIFAKHPDKFPCEAYTLENFIWASANVFSRSVRFTFPGEELQVALVPYIDLMNHNSRADTNIESESKYMNLPLGISEEERSIYVNADTYYNSFEQVYISYGSKPNSQLLAVYGFALEANAQDFVDINVDRAFVNVSMREAKIRMLEFLNLPGKVYPITRDKYSPAMLIFLRILTIEKEDFEGTCTDPDDPEQAFQAMKRMRIEEAYGESSERRTLYLLREILQDILDGYSTTIDEDEALIRDRSLFELLPKNQRMSLRVRYTEKVMIRANLVQIDKVTNTLGKFGQELARKKKKSEEAKNTVWGRLGLELDPDFKLDEAIKDSLKDILKGLDV